MTRGRCTGFSLIEMVIIMFIISVGVLGISSQFGNNTTALATNEILQQATQYAQECAERVIAQRRNNGFDSFAGTPFSCDVDPIATGFTRTAAPVGAIYTGSNSGPCPNNIKCRDVSITVTGANGLNSTINLLLVEY